jgi:hypothetical protein
MFQTKVVEKIKIHILSSTTFSKIVPFIGCGKHAVERGRPQIAILCMPIAYRISKVTDKHS